MCFVNDSLLSYSFCIGGLEVLISPSQFCYVNSVICNSKSVSPHVLLFPVISFSLFCFLNLIEQNYLHRLSAI